MLVGKDRSWPESLLDMRAIKVDCDGNELWSKRMGSEWFEFCYSVVESPDSCYILAGTWQRRGDDHDIVGLVIKLSQDGDSLWSQTYGGDDSDYFFDCIITDDGGMAFVGNTGSYGDGSWDAWLVKTDADGEIEWHNSFGGQNTEELRTVIQTPDGGYALAGITASYGGGRYDLFLVKTNSSGEEEWRNHYGTDEVEWCTDAIQTSDGGYVIAGYSYSEDEYGNYYIVRTNGEGEVIWERQYATEGRYGDILQSVIQTGDGGFVLAGYSSGFRQVSSDDYYIVRIDSTGDVLWTAGYGTQHSEKCYKILATPDGGYALAGKASMPHIGDEFWLVKTGPDPVTVPYLLDPAYPAEVMLHTPYPNPFNSTTRIAFQLPYPSHVNVSIHDQQGREVTVLLNRNLTPGTHEVRWQADDQPSGMYFCMMDADGFRISKGVAHVR